MTRSWKWWRRSGMGFLVLGLVGLTLGVPAQAQQRGGGRSSGGGGGIGGSSSTTTYPGPNTIGDAYFSIDPETRRVVVIAPNETLPYVEQVLTNLDRPKPQVMIKVVFLEVTYNNATDLGVEGGMRKDINGSTTANAANVFGLGGLNTATTNLSLNALGQPTSSFQAMSPINANGAGLYQILGQNYQVTLRAIAQAGSAKVLSRPTILARNNQPATIFAGQYVPLITSVRYDTFGNAISTPTYQNVGVQLTVTPFILSSGEVEMIVAPQISSIDPTTSIPISPNVNAPVLDMRSANTVCVTPNGQTVIIGGLMQDQKTKTETKIPVLGDIPLLGALFRHKTTSTVRTELMIFLTPYIVKDASQLASLSTKERAQSSAPKAFTEGELNEFLDNLPNKPSGKGATNTTSSASKK